jgi:hypothetical protein
MVNNLLFRCSSIGKIVTPPKNKSEKISETAKVAAIDAYVSKKYNRTNSISNKAIEKGLATEEDSITIVSRIAKTFYSKNIVELQNSYISGTPDMFLGKDVYCAELIRDTKSSWDLFTFTHSKKKLDSDYEWQMHGYNWLTGSRVAYVDFCLNNTPFDIVIGELKKEAYKYPVSRLPDAVALSIISNHTFDRETFVEYIERYGYTLSYLNTIEDAKSILDNFVEIPFTERHFCHKVETTEDHIKTIKTKVIDCREFLNSYICKSSKERI